jgi:hypothetical protein
MVGVGGLEADRTRARSLTAHVRHAERSLALETASAKPGSTDSLCGLGEAARIWWLIVVGGGVWAG